MSGPLLDAKQAGELLNVPASWCLAQARENKIPHIRLGKYVRFDRDELDRWWREQTRGPTTLNVLQQAPRRR